MANLRFMPGSYSERYGEEVRARLPSLYIPFAKALEIPHQVARFKGDGPALTRVETYAAVPVGELAGPVADSVNVATLFRPSRTVTRTPDGLARGGGI